MSQAIQQNQNLLRRPQCNNCGRSERVKVFELNTSPSGDSHQVMTWCRTCGEQVIAGLRNAFPEELPIWVKQMQSMSGWTLPEGSSEE